MKRFLIVCAMTLAATVICHTRANAWTNFHLNNQFQIGLQSGGNRFLWGAWRGDQYPIVTTPQGFSTYPAPQHPAGSQHPWLMQKMMESYQQNTGNPYGGGMGNPYGGGMGNPYGGGMGNPYGMNPMMNPMMGGYGQPPMMGGYGAPPMMGGYGMPPMMGGYGMPPQAMMPYGGMPPQFPPSYPGMNNSWPPGMAMYPPSMQQPMMQQPMTHPAMMQQSAMQPPIQAMPVSMSGMPMGAQPSMGGYPMMMMPPPTMYYAGSPVPVNTGNVPPNPIQLVPHMPHADSQPSGTMPPANAQQIGYVWENPFIMRGPVPSYWGN